MGAMHTESIVTTLLAAAAFLKKPIQDLTCQSLKDAYDAARYYLRRRLGEQSDAAKALEQATQKPESEARKAVFVEEAKLAGLESDAELARVMEQIVAWLQALSANPIRQQAHVSGRGNHVQMAGRDLVITTEKHVQRNVITPDDRHLATDQRDTLRDVIAEVADRLAVGSGDPNFAAVHRMLQRRYRVPSYLLIPRNRYDDALKFLKQQRAIHRSRLRHRNPAAYERDFFRAIYTGVGKLGWDRSQILDFAAAKLALKKPLTSLKELGPSQLKSLADAMRHEVIKARSTASGIGSSGGASEKG
jgi:hypothetical protein